MAIQPCRKSRHLFNACELITAMMRNTILGNDLKDHQTLFGEQAFYRLGTLFDAV